MSKNQVLQILYLVAIIIQYYYVLNTKIPQMCLVYKIRKATVETILKQLEYVTKSHVEMQTICLVAYIYIKQE